MEKSHAEWIAEAIIQTDIGGASVQVYSGRGMYGKKTHAVVTDVRIADILRCCIMSANESPELVPEVEDEEWQQDEMGLGIVIY